MIKLPLNLVTEGFVAKAPAAEVEGEKAKLAEFAVPIQRRLKPIW